jgi:hypothetical protein
MGIVIQAWFSPHAERRNDKAFYELLEAQHDSFDAFLADVASGGMIPVTILHTRSGEARGDRIVIDRQTAAIRGDAIDRMQLSTWRLVEAV